MTNEQTRLLLDALLKFQDWTQQLSALKCEGQNNPASDLCDMLYGSANVDVKLIGGKSAIIFYDLLKRLKDLEKENRKLKRMLDTPRSYSLAAVAPSEPVAEPTLKSTNEDDQSAIPAANGIHHRP